MKLEKVSDKMVYSESTLTKRLLFSEKKVLSFVLNLMPGQEIPPHQHEESDLVMYVLTGGGELKVDEKVSNITEGDVVYCVGEEVFSLKNNKNNNLSCFVVIAPRPEPKIYSEEVK